MSKDGVSYYEREDVLFRDSPEKPLEIYQNGWSEYTGDTSKVYRDSRIVDEKFANEAIAENDARCAKIYKQKKAA